MLKFRFLAAMIFLCTLTASGQVPYPTILDTAHARSIREQKIRFEYTIRQPFDSVTGTLKTKAPADTSYTEYDVSGREIDHFYKTPGGKRSHCRTFYNSKGQVIRQFRFDGDSTNGYVDYWSYNEKGEVIQELSCTRKGSAEEIFTVEEFGYDGSGRLAWRKKYTAGPKGAKSEYETTFFFYRGEEKEYTKIVGLSPAGDTTYVEHKVVLGNGASYCQRRYSYKRGRNNQYSKTLVGEFCIRVDSLGARIKTEQSFRMYDYTNGKLVTEENDTTYSDRHDQILDVRGGSHIDKYFYDDRGDFEYMIRYNRRQQPIYRRTKSFAYYQ